MDSIALLYVTFPDEESAKKVGKTLLEMGLIACINYFPIHSMYTWKENIEEGEEIVGLMKTSLSNVAACREKITSLHPYETPCILSSEMEANASYFLYIQQTTFQKPENTDKKFPK